MPSQNKIWCKYSALTAKMFSHSNQHHIDNIRLNFIGNSRFRDGTIRNIFKHIVSAIKLFF